MGVLPYALFSCPDYRSPGIADQFYRSMADVRPRTKKQYANYGNWYMNHSSCIKNYKSTVFTGYPGVFKINEADTVLYPQ
jgi:hypothetical protein